MRSAPRGSRSSPTRCTARPATLCRRSSRAARSARRALPHRARSRSSAASTPSRSPRTSRPPPSACAREGLDLPSRRTATPTAWACSTRRGRFVSPHQVLALLLLHVFRNRGERAGSRRPSRRRSRSTGSPRASGAPLVETGDRLQVRRRAHESRRGGRRRRGERRLRLRLPPARARRRALRAPAAREPRDDRPHASSRPSTPSPPSSAASTTAAATSTCPSTVIRRYLAEVRNRAARRRSPASPSRASQDRDGVKYVLGDRGWLLHRLSGTEPMVRLYCEHEDGTKMAAILRRGREPRCGRLRRRSRPASFASGRPGRSWSDGAAARAAAARSGRRPRPRSGSSAGSRRPAA